MWLKKFLDLEKDLPREIRDKISRKMERSKITPLEFTILESVFTAKKISGYDLIAVLNKHFAGTWKARSGTVYPILSKLKHKGLLDVEDVKSPIGPNVKLYFLTEAGEQIVKTKVNKNFQDQLQFVENFLIELATIYIQSVPEENQEVTIAEVENSLKNTLETVINRFIHRIAKPICPKCNAEIREKDSKYCSNCGTELEP